MNQPKSGLFIARGPRGPAWAHLELIRDAIHRPSFSIYTGADVKKPTESGWRQLFGLVVESGRLALYEVEPRPRLLTTFGLQAEEQALLDGPSEPTETIKAVLEVLHQSGYMALPTKRNCNALRAHTQTLASGGSGALAHVTTHGFCSRNRKSQPRWSWTPEGP